VSTPVISVVIPVYNCGSCLLEISSRLKGTLPQISEDYEILFINDSSPEEAWETIFNLAKNDQRIKGINLSRNFGQHNAIAAGLDNCKGEWVVMMDCDLQDQPEEIFRLFTKTKEGFDIVLGRRDHRGDSFLKKVSGKLFYSIFNYLTGSNLDPAIGTFRIISSKVVESYRLLNERIFFLGAMLDWLGFKVSYIDVLHKDRQIGKSSYGNKKKILLALDGIISFSDRPLRFIIKLGVSICVVSFIYFFILLFNGLSGGGGNIILVAILVIIAFSTGLILSAIGLVGIYIGGILREVKQRPRYILKETINL
jgi:dolichol-phosphate mannosyltransferase